MPIRLTPNEPQRVRIVRAPNSFGPWWVGQENVTIELSEKMLRIQSVHSAARYGVTIRIPIDDVSLWDFEEWAPTG